MKKDLEFDKLMAIYNHISEEEKHFNLLEVEYRKLASQWLLVSLGAIGYILSKENKIPINDWMLVIGICLAAMVGIFVLWLLDLKVYQRLLASAFDEGVKLENIYPEILPRIRNNMSKAMEGNGISSKVFMYYFFSILLLLLVANTAVWMIADAPDWLCIWANSGSVFLTWVFYKVMHGSRKKKRNSKELSNK